MTHRKIGVAESTFFESGVNEKLEPFIHVRVTGRLGTDDEVVLMAQHTAASLRTHALNALATAEAAESDSIVARWLVKDVGLGLEEAAHAVGQLRAHRSEGLVDTSVIAEGGANGRDQETEGPTET